MKTELNQKSQWFDFGQPNMSQYFSEYLIYSQNKSRVCSIYTKMWLVSYSGTYIHRIVRSGKKPYMYGCTPTSSTTTSLLLALLFSFTSMFFLSIYTYINFPLFFSTQFFVLSLSLSKHEELVKVIVHVGHSHGISHYSNRNTRRRRTSSWWRWRWCLKWYIRPSIPISRD